MGASRICKLVHFESEADVHRCQVTAKTRRSIANDRRVYSLVAVTLRAGASIGRGKTRLQGDATKLVHRGLDAANRSVDGRIRSRRIQIRSVQFCLRPVFLLAALLSSQAAWAQFSQQGPKLLGVGAVGLPDQGISVAVSGDGNTAIVGGSGDNGNIGAAWVYIRNGGVWIQQGAKLVGTGAAGNASQGGSVALSGDGNTAIVGGLLDNGNPFAGGIGAVWVFSRNGGVWTQQGAKLVASDAVGNAQQGRVALSTDGNTAIVGGFLDNGKVGAAWIYVRSGDVWTQQGPKLIGTGAVGAAGQGGSIAISGDGNTVIVGGQFDNVGTGAAWVFTRSGGVWTQQGDKLVGAGAAGNAGQGFSVALSGDGNTAIIGGPFDNGGAPGVGAAWVFTRSGGVWNQQGAKLVGTGATGLASQGISVGISADGNTAVVGGPFDNGDRGGGTGAVWVFTRSNGLWSQQGAKLVGTGGVGISTQGGAVALSADAATAIVGGPFDDGGSGAAWIYSAAAANYQGLWWAAPANSESGWGINFAHQGDTIFASWFTYDLIGKGLWLVMTAPKTAPNAYSGTLYTTTGPAFNAVPFSPAQVTAAAVGVGTLTFSDANNGNFAYTVNGIAQNKAITRQVFGTLPTCTTATGSVAAATNYQDLWWAAPAGAESGWGINLTHQGDTIFATWFTYDVDHTPMWLVVTAPKTAPGVFSGTLYRTTGPAFNSVPFNPMNVVATAVGNATFTFSDGNNATFAYTVNGSAQMKAITREVFAAPGTVCQ